MFGIGMQELIIVLVIVLIIFGAGKLPEIGSALGRGIQNFKKSMNDNKEINDQSKKEDEKK
ncbi:MAG: twin-arginine translocase TatA/TatE family subunit [Deltaproteobacteria bacterium HGW-Deltaproteobacteria-13]|jgi:sec-independent protein translocase protein TatA|nr:MAG: twin-arginine translocase TatA/TatE family subunit [Deltaproteobacteria bacterium HGW-Deltaproteobacteria-13]